MIDNSLSIGWTERLQIRIRSGLYRAALVLIGAGIVHIVTVLLVPFFAEKDAWSRLQQSARPFVFSILETDHGSEAHVTGLDPLFVQAACRVQTTTAPVEITFDDPDRFWSLAIIDRLNSVIFSLNDRTVEQGGARFLLVTATQKSRIRERDPLAHEDNIFVDTDQDELVAILRIYAPTAIDRKQVAGVVGNAICRPLTSIGN